MIQTPEEILRKHLTTFPAIDIVDDVDYTFGKILAAMEEYASIVSNVKAKEAAEKAWDASYNYRQLQGCWGQSPNKEQYLATHFPTIK